MDETNQSAVRVLTGQELETAAARATSMLDRLHFLSGELTGVVLIPSPTDFLVGPTDAPSGLVHTAIQGQCLLSDATSSSVAVLLTLGILTSGEVAMNGIARSAWHLLIQSRKLELPEAAAGGHFARAFRAPRVALEASLYAQPVEKLDTSLPASHVWRALVAGNNDAALLSWMHMVVLLSLERTSGGFVASLS